MKRTITFFLILLVTMLLPCLSKAEFSVGLPGAIRERGKTVERKIAERSVPSQEPQVNQPPVAYIDSITPNPATQGTTIHFIGHGTDQDGNVTNYLWKLNISGTLSQSANFATFTLPVGTHTIYFSVRDNQGSWSSAPASAQLVILAVATSTQPLIGYYGVTVDKLYFINAKLADDANEGALEVEFDPAWMLKGMKLEGEFYIYQDQGGKLCSTKTQTFCFKKGSKYIPHVYIDSNGNITDARIRQEDVVDNTIGGYNFCMLPVGTSSPPLPAPVASFSGTPTSGTNPLSVQLTDSSTGSITSRLWSFGDGGTSTTQSPAHTYTTIGTYTITLTVTGPGGSNTATRVNYIAVISPLPPDLFANFSGTPTSGTKPLSVQFTDQSIGSIFSRSWQFGDGANSTIQNPSHTYITTGTYTVSLTVRGEYGSLHAATKTNYIVATEPPPAPVANFSGTPTSGTVPLSVQFTDQSAGSITTRFWQFGNGATSTTQNPAYTYTTIGTYTVSLLVVGPGGSNTLAKAGFIVVTPATSTQPLTGYYGVTVDRIYFINSKLADNANEGTLEVEFDPAWMLKGMKLEGEFYIYQDQGEKLCSTKTQTFCFKKGSKYIPHAFIDRNGHVTDARIRQEDVVDNTIGGYNFCMLPVGTSGTSSPSLPAPAANFSGTPTSGTTPLSVQFTDLSTGSITSRLWQFGDGGTATAQNPAYTFTTTGTYTVSLTATGPGGSNTATKVNFVAVVAPLPPVVPVPVAIFSGTPTSCTTIQFTNQSTGSITTWFWQFGDGGTSTLQSPAHTYTTIGTYTVTLTVVGPGGNNSKLKVARWTFGLE